MLLIEVAALHQISPQKPMMALGVGHLLHHGEGQYDGGVDDDHARKGRAYRDPCG